MEAAETSKLKVLITGGAGKIGSYFARYAASRYAIRVADKAAWNAERWGALEGEFLNSDLRDLESCRAACEGMDAVIHLAADPDPEAKFHESLLENNIILTYNMLQAAKDAGCKRFIFASSIHAVGAYPIDVQIKPDMALRPTSLYGVTKGYGEAMAAHFALNEGLPAIALRIGTYRLPDEGTRTSSREIDAYLNGDDFNHLLTQCLETPGITFLIAHAISDNRFKRLDLTETREVLGYNPRADVFELKGMIPKERT